MPDSTWTVRLSETYCPHCHLATRADNERCLHCRKRLHVGTPFQTPLSTNGYAGREAAGVLLVSPFEEDHVYLGRLLREPKWRLRGARACLETWTLLRQHPTPVVICERDLPDGNWRDVLEAVTWLNPSPNLIVTSRLADECLWGEVLNLGGHDVLAKPLDEGEVLRALDSACRRWNRPNETMGYSKASFHSELKVGSVR